MERIDIRELCFIKMLLIKCGYFVNESINIRGIEITLGIDRDYFIDSLRHLIKLQMIDCFDIELDYDYIINHKKKDGAPYFSFAQKHSSEELEIFYQDPTPDSDHELFRALQKELKESITIDEYLSSFNLPRNISDRTDFQIKINKEKLNKYLADYLTVYRENKFITNEKCDFNSQKNIVSSIIADATDKIIPLLTDVEKSSPFGIDITIDCENLDYNKFDILEILLIIENERLVKITGIDLGTIFDYDYKPVDVCNKIGLTVADYKNNKLLLTNKSDNAINYVFHEYGMHTGHLTIGNYPKITFTKKTADIVNYFYEIGKFDKEFHNYQDFNKFISDPKLEVVSDEFNKKIQEINKRICRDTKKVIKELIIKGKNKSNEANIYRWRGN
ncbi:MAG: hypothetical protein WCP18_00950 [bacterium]